jgi:hypothetical protein
MAYAIQSGVMGLSPIGSVDSTRKSPEGQIVQAVDPVLGGGEFVYLAGCASTVVGSVVQYDQIAHTTTLAAATANLPGPLAVAMAATIANTWGWYQRCGAAVVSKTAAAINPGAIQLAGGGQVAGGAAAGLTVEGARAVVTAGAGTTTVQVELSHPSATAT